MATPPPLEPAPHVAAALDAAAKQAGIEPALVRAVAFVESHFNPAAIGPATPKGWQAKGLMQLSPLVCKDLTDPLDAKQNAFAGAKWLASLMRKYNGDTEVALAAYNYGPGNLERSTRPPPATIAYVAKVMARLAVERSAIAPTRLPPPPQQQQLPLAALSHSMQCPACGAELAVQVARLSS